MTNLTIAAPGNRITLNSLGSIVLLTGEAALSQSCLQYMQGLLGEMLFQPNDGLPYFQDIWLSQNFAKWEAAARATLMSVAGVTRIISLTYSVTADVFSYVAIIQTIYSPTLTVTDTVTQGAI